MAEKETLLEGNSKPQEIPGVLSILPLRDAVLFPGLPAPLAVTREGSVKLVDDAAVAQNRIIGIVAMRDPQVEIPRFSDIYHVGVAGVIRVMFKTPEGVRMIVHGIRRIRLIEPVQEEPYIVARVEPIEEVTEFSGEDAIAVEALARNVGAQFQRVVQMSPELPSELQAIPLNVTSPGQLADFIATHLPVSTAEKQAILEEANVLHRLRLLSTLLQRELNVLEVGSRIQSEVASEVGRVQREYYLREQLKAIQRELGETDERQAEIDELRRKIEELGMPEEARKEAERELDRLARIPPASPEYTVARTYLEWLTSLPWNVSTEDNLDIQQAREVLDADHFGLERVKDRRSEERRVGKECRSRWSPYH